MLSNKHKELLTALSQGPISFDDCARLAGLEAIRTAAKAGYCINRLDGCGVGRLSITTTGINALNAEGGK